MAEQIYYSVFTQKGLELLTESIQNGTKLGITSMAFGDGGGELPTPDASFISLVNEVYRTELNSISPDPNNRNWLRADAIIASAIGGFNIRELGLYSGDILVAYSNYPSTYKPNPADGTARIMTFRMVLQIDNVANFELVIDPDVVLATHQYVDNEILKHRPVKPEDFGAKGDGVTDDLIAWQAMLDSRPSQIDCNPNANYIVSDKVYIRNNVVINGNNAIYTSPKPISTTQMLSYDIVGAPSKSTISLSLSSVLGLNVGDRVMIYYGGDNSDQWYTDNRRNPEKIGITSQITNILSIDGNTITIANGLDFDLDPTKTSRIYKIHNITPRINNLNFKLHGNYYDHTYSCNMYFYKCTFSHRDLEGEITFRDQTSYNTIFNNCIFNTRLKLMYGYGSHSGIVEDCTFFDGVEHDAVLITYAGAVGILSMRNKFYRNGSYYSPNVAGIYFGAKCRDCVSMDDFVDGLALGFRIMFGAVGCQIVRMVTQHINSTYVGLIDKSQRIKIKDCTFKEKIVRTLDVDDFEFSGNTMLSNYRGTGVPPLKLDLNRVDTAVKAKNYLIKDNEIQGEMRTWISVDNLKVLNNIAAIWNSVTSVTSFDTQIKDNRFGWVRLYHCMRALITGNIIDYNLLDSIEFPKDSALELYGNTFINEFRGNTIIHPSKGVLKTGGGFNIVSIGDNNIFSPQAYDIGVSQSTPPLTGESVLKYVGIGTKARTNEYGISSKKYFSWDGSKWVLDSDFGKIYTYELNYTPVANGVFEAYSRTIQGISIGDNAIIECAGITPDKAEYIAKVTAANTLQIYYRNFTSDTTSVKHTVYVTILK
ncbi:hypothetical protein FJV00_10855 [Acinetobacter baumannii]|uniref:phage tail protein n=1 Tax=Acinetobacter baumannii TaxID=470 RepID=UPI00112602E2|nr:phage tail protein [Acinetobacter baumannii]TPU09466.1 hypothetical protein FJV00_10855 [Acinetobacter baumannii]